MLVGPKNPVGFDQRALPRSMAQRSGDLTAQGKIRREMIPCPTR